MTAISGTEGGSCIGMSFERGDPMFRGTVDGGDLVLVDKISYHFRTPKRGEVFVFDTIGLEKRMSQNSSASASQAKATHYIKRLCGVPGDVLRIDSPHLMVNGKIASEKGIATAMSYPNSSSAAGTGYSYALNSYSNAELRTVEDTLELRKDTPPGLREYAALGDNSGSSLDSRYWGAVKEYNLVGPALFSLWPFTTGHWGMIK
jgi:signal peptidase I